MVDENYPPKRIMFTPFIAGLFILFVARDILGLGINKYIFLMYCSFFLVKAKYIEILYILCFLIPLYNGLPGTYILLVALICIFCKNPHQPKKAIILIGIFLLLEIFASIWYPAWDGKEILSYMMFLSVFFIMIYDETERSYLSCLELFYIGTFIFCFVVIISGIRTAPSNWLSLFAKGWFRFGETNTGSGNIMMLKGNANELGYFSSVGIAVGFVLMKQKKGISKIYYLLTILWMLICGTLSLSRTFFIVSAIIVLLFLLSQMKSPRGIVLTVLTFSILVAVLTKYLFSNPDILHGLLSRFTDDTMRTGGNRTVIFAKQLNVFLEMPRCLIFGTGVTKYTDILKTASAHNMIIQILMCYGIPAGILFLISLFVPIFLQGKHKLLYYLPFISVLLFVQTIQFINPYALMLPYAIGIYSLKLDSQNNDITNNQ